MARIRSIKPEFFTSEQVVSLSPMARLLFIATWCEADREGRLEWKPRTFKIRYFPADNCDIESMASELVDSGLVVLYGGGLAYVPGFAKHQVINGRESDSLLPDPETARVTDASRTRPDACPRKEGRKEGKGREGASGDARRGSRLPADWSPTADELRWAIDVRPDLDVQAEVEKFSDYWKAQPGQKGVKTDWAATWRNWIRNSRGAPGRPAIAEARPLPRLTA